MTSKDRPLGKIALALSGGGYRAAAFHLGTMKALHELGLLEDVRVLSTASGGSIVGARYLLSVAAGHDFDTFAKELTEILKRNIVAEALDKLHEGERPVSLIQRAAEVYSELFGGKRLGDLAKDANVTERFDRVIVNATHFSLGYGFRFTLPATGARFGNGAVKMTPADAWKKIRLGDAVAASSCFPAGFEPLQFPEDFDWQGGAAPKVRAKANVPGATADTSLPLMDGGIYDNQALDAVLLVNDQAERTGPADDLGLLFISDTDQRKTPFYAPKPHGWLLRSLGRLPLWAMLLGAAAVAGVATWGAWSTQGPLATFAHVVVTLSVTLLLVALGLLALAQASVPFPYPLARRLLRASLGDLGTLLVSRVSSVLALTTTVFMYRIRALGQKAAFATLDGKVVAAQIYDATGADDSPTPKPKRDPSLVPSAEVVQRATVAREMPTMLWMTSEQRDAIVATGHATALLSLVRYLRRWRSDGEMRPEPFPSELHGRVEKAWATHARPEAPADDEGSAPA